MQLHELKPNNKNRKRKESLAEEKEEPLPEEAKGQNRVPAIASGRQKI